MPTTKGGSDAMKCPICRIDPKAHAPSGLCVTCYLEWMIDADDEALRRAVQDGREACDDCDENA